MATDPKWGLNWKRIAAILSNLAAADLKAFAIADNRTAELAEWDSEVVERQLKELAEEIEGFDATELGLDVKELDGLLKGDFEQADGFTPAKPKKEPPAKTDTYTPQFLLIIKCTSEKQQADLINEFEGRGIECAAPSE